MLQKIFLLLSVAALAMMLLGMPSAMAASIYWQAAAGDWSLPDNWGGTLPTSSDDAYIVNDGTATVVQDGAFYRLYLGNSGAGHSGSVQLADGNLYADIFECIGYSGTGTFTQSGGTNAVNNPYYSDLVLGYNSGSDGTYNLSGTGQLIVSGSEYIGSYGTATFIQSSGTNTVTSYSSAGLYIGNGSGSRGSYILSGGGELSVLNTSEYIGYSGTGTFTHSAGTNQAGNVYLGYNSGSSGAYNLSNTGQLTAKGEYIGYAATGLFEQSGGANSANYVSIGPNGKYKFTGGTLQLNGGLDNLGTLDLDGSPAVINATGSIINFARSGGILKNTQAASLIMDANSLLIVPQGFNPANAFKTYINDGVLHTVGTMLSVPSVQTIYGIGTIDDAVHCEGTIISSSGYSITLNNGLTISNNGSVSLGNKGDLLIEDSDSGMSGGSLSVYHQYVGKTGSGTFTQSAGTNKVQGGLYLGYNSGSNGTYNLSETGQLTAYVYVGYSGTGTFHQSAGNSSGGLILGYNTGSIGNYILSGTGKVGPNGSEYIGDLGTGTFTHLAGINATSSLYVGYGTDNISGSNGTYNLSGTGQLSAL